MAASTRRPSRFRWLIGGIIVVILLAVGGPFVYFRFIQGDAPAKLSLSTTTTPKTTATPTGTGHAPLAGTWKVGTGSTAGYRVEESLRLVVTQSNTAVGRTSDVSGSMTIAGTHVTKAAFTVDMASVKSVGNAIDGAIADRRDGQFTGRIMETDQFPTATFTLTKPIDLAPVPAEGVEAKYSATGKLTLHGTTKTVTIPLTAKRTGNVIAVQGILNLTFADYGIQNPSGGPASVGDTGQLEFIVQLQPK